ncbi:MAG: hypothetical protein RBR86_05305 [Pseudobdellovibrionaceae bacterium]|jgi:hypothetical protein|nr:hypothetical protein [Pseudobdellovibrionaceae bacterium]
MQRLTTAYMSSVIAAPPLRHYMRGDNVSDDRDIDALHQSKAPVSSESPQISTDADRQDSCFLSQADDEVGRLRIQFDDTILLNVTAGDVSGTRDLSGLRQRVFNRAFTMAHEHDDKEKHSRELQALSSLLLIEEVNRGRSGDLLLSDRDENGLGHMILHALYDYFEPKFH